MNRIRTGPGIAVSLLVSVAYLQATPLQTPREKRIELFSESEASELRIDENWDPVPRARSAPLGPGIVVQSPALKRIDGNATIEASSPTSFVVRFEENQAPIDMSSLEVTAHKGLFRVSLTDTLLPYVQGTVLAVDGVDVPSGKFQIRIHIKDAKGQETVQTYRLIVGE